MIQWCMSFTEKNRRKQNFCKVVHSGKFMNFNHYINKSVVGQSCMSFTEKRLWQKFPLSSCIPVKLCNLFKLNASIGLRFCAIEGICKAELQLKCKKFQTTYHYTKRVSPICLPDCPFRLALFCIAG